MIARLKAYESKRASVQHIQQDFGIDLALKKIYRMMNNWTTLEAHAADATDAQQLLEQPLDVVYLDCTTLRFESLVEDRPKQSGCSKDAGFKDSQALLAVMVTPGAAAEP